LYSEAILYVYYVIIAVYGYVIWSKGNRNQNDLPISDYSLFTSIRIVIFGFISALVLGRFFSVYTDADLPYVDAQTTTFSFIASYLEVHKILSGWIFWIVINAVTIGLYAYKGLYIYAVLMVVYLIVSFSGYFAWRRKVML
jgi:nicotinamide mononucleotide transporter